jgi:hypothetical protein
VLAAGGPAPVGDYSLLVNFGSQSQPAVSPPSTIVASQPDQGGSSLNQTTSSGTSGGGLLGGVGGLVGGLVNTASNVLGDLLYITIGTQSGWADYLDAAPSAEDGPGSPVVVPPASLPTRFPGLGGSAGSPGSDPQAIMALDSLLAQWMSSNPKSSPSGHGNSNNPSLFS